MKEETIALHFENNELAAISEAISECKKNLDSSRDLTDFNNAENKIENALYNLMISEMEDEGSS
ncbi:hypothetical protein A5819_003506 [Enterococcus sp. 7E2_DIV0204]|uniref:hypothetical protein n=1 Tax=unclassified Enterococcus TaxID=2608891 RepID=UPI000A333867|nr:MULTISPECIES: hypothetical protein [unclassified Enterococcus]OTN83956.1 hypothetical protein A5819_003506 [Enterococcus sp. 7E2_DIV0204]OTP46864.1 hypothetical protein A5884_003742 [Enterococcus sp. 7D2_DIV0200]